MPHLHHNITPDSVSGGLGNAPIAEHNVLKKSTTNIVGTKDSVAAEVDNGVEALWCNGNFALSKTMQWGNGFEWHGVQTAVQHTF